MPKFVVATTCRDYKSNFRTVVKWLKRNKFVYNSSNKFWYKKSTKHTAVKHVSDIIDNEGWIAWSKSDYST